MIIIMKKNATEEEIKNIIKEIENKGFQALVTDGIERKVIGIKGDVSTIDSELFYKTGVEEVKRISRPYKLVSREFIPKDTVIDIEGIKIGGSNSPVIIAGPCAVESREQIIETAKAVKEAGAHILRGGAFKPRSNPYSFQGLKEVGLEYLKEAGEITGMPTDSEAVGESYVKLVSEYCSIIHIGARNGKSFELLKKAGKIGKQSRKPILLKRGENATVKEFLGAAEYIANEGCSDIILCLRGIRTYENKENGFQRYTPDLGSISVLKKKTHLPVIFDPSHAAGDREYVRSLCRGAIAMGADGLMVETHLDPDNAKSDAPQQVRPKTLQKIIEDVNLIYKKK